MPPLVAQAAVNQRCVSAQEVTVGTNDVTGAPMVLPFSALFDRGRWPNETDVLITAQDFRDIIATVFWTTASRSAWTLTCDSGARVLIGLEPCPFMYARSIGPRFEVARRKDRQYLGTTPLLCGWKWDEYGCVGRNLWTQGTLYVLVYVDWRRDKQPAWLLVLIIASIWWNNSLHVSILFVGTLLHVSPMHQAISSMRKTCSISEGYKRNSFVQTSFQFEHFIFELKII